MRITGLAVSLLALSFVGGAHADAFKCKTADGRTVISSLPCESGSRTEAVRASEEISPERKHQAEQDLQRQQKMLAEREAARVADQQRESENRRKLADEESQRQAQCLQNAQREPDPQLRANLIAACTGTPAPQPVVVNQPVYIPVPAVSTRRTPNSINVNASSHPEPKEAPAQAKVPCRQGNGKPCEAPIGAGR